MLGGSSLTSIHGAWKGQVRIADDFDELPDDMHHRDPFERMLIAQAQVEGALIISGDARLRAYGVPVLWGPSSSTHGLRALRGTGGAGGAPEIAIGCEDVIVSMATDLTSGSRAGARPSCSMSER